MDLAGFEWSAFLARPEPLIVVGVAVTAGSFARPLVRAEGFRVVWRLAGMAGVLLPLLFLSAAPETFSYGWLPLTGLHLLYDAAGFLCPVAAAWYGLRRRWPDVVNGAAGFLVVFVYVKCFDWWWDVMPRYLFFLMLGGLALGTLVLLGRLRKQTGQV